MVKKRYAELLPVGILFGIFTVILYLFMFIGAGIENDIKEIQCKLGIESCSEISLTTEGEPINWYTEAQITGWEEKCTETKTVEKHRTIEETDTCVINCSTHQGCNEMFGERACIIQGITWCIEKCREFSEEEKVKAYVEYYNKTICTEWSLVKNVDV